MRSSLLSRFVSIDPDSRFTRLVTWFLRVAVGTVFIFSGFVKAVDPWGTLYKVNEYLAAMNLDIWPNLVLVGVFGLCALEFAVGAMLMLGCFRRSATWIAALFMCLMLPLTLWIAISDPVPDCGCFGDAVIISNWATFWKNVVLAAAVGWLIIYNRRIHWIITPAIQWIALLTVVLFIISVSLWGYECQPFIDFRAYKTGTPLIPDADADADEYMFVYEKNGVRKEFSQSDVLPDDNSGWVFIESVPVENTAVKSSDTDEGKALRLWSNNGLDDVTDDVLVPEGDRLLLLMPDLKDVSIASTWKINSLYSWARKKDIDMIAVVAGTPGDIDLWNDRSMPEYPIYTADDTAIKEVARGNPAVVFTRDGVVEWKSTLQALVVDDFMTLGEKADPMSLTYDSRSILINLVSICLCILAVLTILSFSPLVARLFPKFSQTGPKKDNTSNSDNNAKTDI